MNTFVLDNINLNLDTILLGGQSFSWCKINNFYYGIVEDNIIKIRQLGNKLYWQTFPEKDNYKLFYSYFQIDNLYKNLNLIDNLRSKDDYIRKAVKYLGYLIILKQPIFQTTISFIISSNRNIPLIRQSIQNFCVYYGEKIIVDDIIFYTFPNLDKLIQIDEHILRYQTKIGYRSQYVKSALEFFTNQNVFVQKSDLLSIKGIGNKIADCIAVFSLGERHVTPLDVWAKRALEKYYSINHKIKYEDCQKWLQNYFGRENVAIAGQYLFEYIRIFYKTKNFP